MDVQQTLRDLTVCLEEHWFHELELLHARNTEYMTLQIAVVARLLAFAQNFGLPDVVICFARDGTWTLKACVNGVYYTTPFDTQLGRLTMRVYEFHVRPTIVELRSSGIAPLAEMLNQHIPTILCAAFAAHDNMVDRRRLAEQTFWAMAMWYGVADLHFCVEGVSGNGETAPIDNEPWQMFFTFKHYELDSFRLVDGLVGESDDNDHDNSEDEDEFTDEGEVAAMFGPWVRLFRRVRW